MTSEWRTEAAQYQSLGAVVGRRMRAVRQERGWTLSELASRLEGVGMPMHLSTVSKLETGGTKDIPLGAWYLIARALDVDAVELLVPDEDAAEVVIGAEVYSGADLRGHLIRADRGAGRARALLSRWEELQTQSEAVAAELRELVAKQEGR